MFYLSQRIANQLFPGALKCGGIYFLLTNSIMTNAMDFCKGGLITAVDNVRVFRFPVPVYY